MSLSKIKSVEFWAREHRMPLFWLTDPRHNQVSENRLFLYKNAISHCYFVNQSSLIENEKGYIFFNKKGNFSKYIIRGQAMIQKMEKAKSDFFKVDLKKLSDKGLMDMHDRLLNVLFDFSALYAETEAERTKKFEGIKNKKIQDSLQKIGGVRFELRKAVESFFPILLYYMLKEIVRRYGIKPLDWFFYNHLEVRDVFKGKKITSEVITERKKGYALLNIDHENELYVGSDFKLVWHLIKKLSQDHERGLKGLIVQRGKVNGRVELLVHNIHNLSSRVRKFKAGNILVTEMTTPNTIMACKKAAAIITDEGGLLCHAAIISRELKIPCIVGTKYATQILKNGDEVEVDAELGTVRIIARKKQVGINRK